MAPHQLIGTKGRKHAHKVRVRGKGRKHTHKVRVRVRRKGRMRKHTHQVTETNPHHPHIHTSLWPMLR